MFGRTTSFVMAPVDSVSSRISMLITKIWIANMAGPVTMTVGAHSGGGARGQNASIEPWGQFLESAQAPPRDGIRANKATNLVIATRIVQDTATAVGASDSSKFALTAGQAAYVVTAVATSIDTAGADPLPAVREVLKKLTPASITQMAAEHNSWWAMYWSRSTISLPGWPDIERFWYRFVYMVTTALVRII